MNRISTTALSYLPFVLLADLGYTARLGMYSAFTSRAQGGTARVAGRDNGGVGHAVFILKRDDRGDPLSLPISYDHGNLDAQTSVLILILKVVSIPGGSHLLEKPAEGNELMLRLAMEGVPLDQSLRVYSFRQLKQVKLIDLLKDGNLSKPF